MKKTGKGKDIRQLKLKVLGLYDDFTHFSCQSAFLCDSFSALSAQQECVEPATIDGIHFYSRWLKIRTLEIKQELREVHEELKMLSE